MSDDDLPVVLVSAADAAAADAIISELVDNEVESMRSEGSVVWELCNKYYTARVRMCAWPDASPGTRTPPDASPGTRTPPDASPGTRAPPAAEAHVIYLAEDECDAATLERRAGALAGGGAGGGGDDECAVRLAACAAERPAEGEGAALSDAARKHRYELVYLRESSPAELAGPFPELRGAARAREALHAHAWPGLRLRAASRPQQADDDDFSPFQSYRNGADSPGSDSSPEPSEEECVRRAELLASMLGAVHDMRGREGEARGERAARAERLVAAACRALGEELPRL